MPRMTFCFPTRSGCTRVQLGRLWEANLILPLFAAQLHVVRAGMVIAGQLVQDTYPQLRLRGQVMFSVTHCRSHLESHLFGNSLKL